ncbi:AAA family ATPase [Nocardia sp. MDA0666]|uniref:AAA family ATPase n=1 Tax=Nocardia sp. MDA0666 TaxID=2135448 RepID=UPI001E47B0DE|nr:AAA family ATPase [Nocardia sp. MDA0666]
MSGGTQGSGSGFRMYRPGAGGAAGSGSNHTEAHADSDPSEIALPDDATVDLSTDLAGKNVEDTLARLDAELIGLATVKKRVREIAALLLIDRARQRFGLQADRPTMHMSFTGGPGTGKTTVALRMAEMLHALGYIRKPKVHTVTRDDLVGQFIGHTAPKTKEALAKAAGGVLFIDEAYYLFRPENERDYGQEVIEILLQEMETERSSLVVIFAGYPDRMETFFSANPGLSSRVAHHIEFPDYTREELLAIAEVMVTQQNFGFGDSAAAAFDEYLAVRMTRPRFANARSVRNAVDRCRLRQANRLVQEHRPLGKADLMTLTTEDIYGSSVFGDRVRAAEEAPACPTE